MILPAMLRIYMFIMIRTCT